MWLLSKNRLKEAEKSLRWLRGWVPASAVQKEFGELVRYRDNSRLVLPERRREATEAPPTRVDGDAARTAYANPAVSLDDERPRPAASDATAVDRSAGGGATAVAAPDEAIADGRVREGAEAEEVVRVERKATLEERLRDLVRPQMLKPMMLVVAFFTFHNGSGFPAMRPYMVTVFEELTFPVDAHWATVSEPAASALRFNHFVRPVARSFPKMQPDSNTLRPAQLQKLAYSCSTNTYLAASKLKTACKN